MQLQKDLSRGLEQIEELFEDVDSEKEAAKRIRAAVLPAHRERGFTSKPVVREGRRLGRCWLSLPKNGSRENTAYDEHAAALCRYAMPSTFSARSAEAARWALFRASSPQ
jgi:hypothetical protein